MAVRTISQSNLNPNQFYRPGWAGALEGVLGGVTGVANQYLDKRNAIKKWLDLNFDQAAAEVIAMLPPDAQAQILENYLKDPEHTLQASKRIGLARAQKAQGFETANAAPSQTQTALAGLGQPESQIYAAPSAPAQIPLEQLAARQQAQGQAPQAPGQQAPATPSALDLLTAASQGRGVGLQPQATQPAGAPQQLAALGQQQPSAAPGTESALEGLQNALAASPQAIRAPETVAPRPVPQIEERKKSPFEGISQPRGRTNPFAEGLALQKQELALRKQEAAEQKQREAKEAKEQARIDKKNAPWVKQHEKRMETTREMVPILEQLREDWNSGKVASGLAGTIGMRAPWSLNKESARFMQNGQKLQAMILTLPSFGTSTNAKIKFTEALKTALSQSHDAQGSTIDNMFKELDSNFDIDRIYEQVLDENGGKQPEDLGLIVNRVYKQQHPGGESARIESEKKSLATPASAKSQEDSGEESLLSQAGRFGARTASRIAETAVGAPGDILSAGAALTKYATGGKTPSYEEIQKKLPVSLPTSQQTKEWISEMSGGRTDPQGPYEKIIDSVIDTAASLFVPGKGVAAAGKLAGKLATTAPKAAQAIRTGAKIAFPFSGTDSWKRALAKGAAGETAGGAISILGGGPGAQALGKIALMTSMGTSGTRKTLKDTMGAAYESAEKAGEKAGKEGIRINAKPLGESVQAMKKSIGTQVGPEKATVKEIVTDVEKFLRDKRSITINEAVDLKKKLNEWIGLGYQPKITGEKYLPKAARTEVQKLNRLVSHEISQYGLKHPDFGKPYAIGEELYKGFNAFDKIKRNIAHIPKVGTAGGIYGLFYNPAKAVAGATAAYLATPVAQHTTELVGLLSKSPHARQIYAQALKHAAENNMQGFAKDVARLDKEMKD
jgi:hypothetical protein